MSSVIDISLLSDAVERRAGHDDTGGVDVGGDDNDDDIFDDDYDARHIHDASSKVKTRSGFFSSCS